MPSKRITVTSTVPNTITNLSIAIAPRQGDNPKRAAADGFVHLDWAWHHAELDEPMTVTYGDDHNPYIDAVLVNFTPSNTKSYGTQIHFGTTERGDEQDNALNMYDTFLITLVKDDRNGVSAVMECKNSNGSGGTVTFPRRTA